MTSLNSSTAAETHAAQEAVIIRQARLFEGHHIGRIAAETYYNTPLIKWLSPHRDQYPEHYERSFHQRVQKRMLDPRNVTFVAYTASNPDYPIGYAQFVRLGDDEGARQQTESRSSLERAGLVVLSWVYAAKCFVENKVKGEKSGDIKAMAAFERRRVQAAELHWDNRPERKNRWYAQSVVVRKEFQGRKVGKRLMAEVLKRAKEESVPVCLEASDAGEKMYASVGFELLARFDTECDLEERGGGVMMWSPPGRKPKLSN